MTQLFRFRGHCETESSSHPEPMTQVWSEVVKRLPISKKHTDEYILTVDTAVPIGFGGIVNAAVVMLQVQGGKVTVTITSADGTSQNVPADALFILISATTPVTAISVTRSSGIPTNVNVLLAEAA